MRKLQTLVTIVRRCRNWPGLVASRLGLIDPPCEIRLRGGLVLGSDRPVSDCWGQVFEPAVADIYGIEKVQPDMIWDVGGNMGSFSSLAAFTHPQSVIHAFEPQDQESAEFRANLVRNGLSNVTLHQSVLTCDGREVGFSIHDDNRGASSLFNDGGRKVNLQSLAPSDVDTSDARSLFIKLDCEGAEGELIEWVCRNRSRLPATVWLACEYHPWCPVSLETSVNRLREAGFVVQTGTRFGESYLFARALAETS